MISKGKKKVFRSLHGGSLSLCKCRRARIKGPAGRSLPMSGIKPSTVYKAFKTKHVKQLYRYNRTSTAVRNTTLENAGYYELLRGYGHRRVPVGQLLLSVEDGFHPLF